MNKKLIRINLSPLIFIYGMLLPLALMFPPMTLIIIYIIGSLFLESLKALFNLLGSNLEYGDFMILHKEHNLKWLMLDRIVALLVPVWFPFYVTYLYIKDGTIWTCE